MHSTLESSKQFASIAQGMRRTERASADLVQSIVAKMYPNIQELPVAFTRVRKLIAAKALTEAMLALIDCELPQWKLRRLAYDEGEWHCALSRQRELPEWLDQSVESSHKDLTLAIALACIEVLNSDDVKTRPMGRTIPAIRAKHYETLTSENYA